MSSWSHLEQHRAEAEELLCEAKKQINGWHTCMDRITNVVNQILVSQRVMVLASLPQMTMTGNAPAITAATNTTKQSSHAMRCNNLQKIVEYCHIASTVLSSLQDVQQRLQLLSRKRARYERRDRSLDFAADQEQKQEERLQEQEEERLQEEQLQQLDGEEDENVMAGRSSIDERLQEQQQRLENLQLQPKDERHCQQVKNFPEEQQEQRVSVKEDNRLEQQQESENEQITNGVPPSSTQSSPSPPPSNGTVISVDDTTAPGCVPNSTRFCNTSVTCSRLLDLLLTSYSRSLHQVCSASIGNFERNMAAAKEQASTFEDPLLYFLNEYKKCLTVKEEKLIMMD